MTVWMLDEEDEPPEVGGPSPYRVRAAFSARELRVCTGVCIRRSRPALLACMTPVTKPFPHGYRVSDGRGWDRTSDLPRVKTERLGTAGD
jgi:hypothetical protein